MDILNDPRIIRFFREHANHRDSSPPLAVFDCDGTVIRGDIGEAMLYYQIEEFCFKTSPAEIWPDYPERAELDRLYRTVRDAGSGRAGEPAFRRFADRILEWYFGQIEGGQVEKACADIVRLFAGYTLAQVREIADATFAREISAQPGERGLGSRTRPSGVRFIKESRELLVELVNRGFEIWAVSGSNRWSVEPVFRQLGIPPERVIGIDCVVENGVLTSRVVEPVPIRTKKIDALKRHTGVKPLIVASDSRNDIPLLQYSADLKLFVSSRRKDWTLFFTGGNIQRDDSWVVVEAPTIEGV